MIYQYTCKYLLQQLDPSEKIPEDFMELGSDERVLKLQCPDYLKDIRDEDVSVIEPLIQNDNRTKRPIAFSTSPDKSLEIYWLTAWGL